MAKKVAVSDQKYINSGLYLDAKMQPVANYNELNKIPVSQRFVGMEVVVLSDQDGDMAKYWLVGGTANYNWVRKVYSGVKYEQGKGIIISGTTISIDDTVITSEELEDKINQLIENTGSTVNQTIVKTVKENLNDGKLTVKSGDDILGEFTANQKDNTEIQLWEDFNE